MTLAEKIAARKALGMTAAEYTAHLAKKDAPKVDDRDEFMLHALRTNNLGLVKQALNMMDNTAR